MTFVNTPVAIDFRTAGLLGEPVVRTRRILGDLKGIFASESSRAAMPQETPVYQVECYFPVPEGEPGGLFFGNTHIWPGMVGNEYFMTKGHFHHRRECSEYYWCVRGEGVLLLMSEDRVCRAERMTSGSLHYIPGGTAHRVANIGDETLCFGACWPAEAGHDYDTIAVHGFSNRILCVNGEARLFPAERA